MERVQELLLREALSKYGIKLRIVLETAVELAKTNRLRGTNEKGDFDYKSLVEALKVKGFNYNPSQLLRILERDYGIIVTSYHTSGQHWYKFKDLELVEAILKRDAVKSEYQFEDPEIALIKIQVRSLRPREIISFLKRLAMKPRLSLRDVEKFEAFAFSKLPKVVKLLKIVEEYEDELIAEARILREIVELAYDVAERIGGVGIELDAELSSLHEESPIKELLSQR